MDEEKGRNDLSQALADGRLREALNSLPIALVGKTTCAFSLGAQSALERAAAGVGGAGVVTDFWVDRLPKGAAIHDALKKETGQATVPYVFVNGEFLGGCDDVVTLQASGSLASKVHAAAAAHALPATSAAHKPTAVPVPDSAHGDSPAPSTGGDDALAVAHAGPPLPDAALLDPALQPALCDGTPPAYPCLFWFPEVVDSNVVRLVVAVCILGIAFRRHSWAHYLILGLAVDNVGRTLWGPGPSPLGQLARCGAALLHPKYKPGVPKQFASFCGTFMSVVAAALLLTSGYDPKKVIASCFLAAYAALALLEAALDFCMGCVMFGWAVRFGLVPRQVYTLGIATRPEAEYTYEEAVKRLELPEPKQVRLGYPGKPPSAVDVRYKTKLNDHDRQSFHLIKHVKIMQWTIVLAVAGQAVLWRVAALPAIGGAAGLSLSGTPADVLTVFAVVLYVLAALMYAAKLARFPRKVRKEWFCPLRSNAFVIPPASLVLIAFATAGAGFSGAATLAKVLFWLGAPATLALALLLAARWITDPHSSEHLNPAWLLPPTACFVCALVAPFLDARYTEAAYLWFAAATVLALPLYTITFQRSILFQEPDDRQRPLKWTWVSTLAVACAAQVVLAAATPDAAGGAALDGQLALPFSFVSRLLYLAALALAFVLGLLYLTGHASRLRFDVASWSLAFPLEALALATLLYAAAVPGSLTNGMAYAGLTVASAAVVVLALHTVQALLMRGIFVMDPKYAPLSQQILTHEAFRASGQRLKLAAADLATAPKGGGINAAALAQFAVQFRRYRLAHAWHSRHEDSVIFKEFEAYAPGLCGRQHREHAQEDADLARWAELLELAEAAADPAAARDGALAAAGAQAVRALAGEVPAFIDAFEAHLVGEEEHLQRGGRKHMNIDLQKAMLRRIWDATPVEVWAEFLPWVVQNLPMHAQRVKFVRCWAAWALPERAQLIGRFVALGVEAPIWERLAQAVPEIIPRGAPGWRKYS